MPLLSLPQRPALLCAARHRQPRQGVACRRPAVPAAAATAAQQPQPQPQQQPPRPPTAEQKAQVAEALDAAQLLESDGRQAAALQLLQQELAACSQQEGAWRRGSRMLRQRLSQLLFTAGNYSAALEEARAVHAEACGEAGERAGETILLGLRLGIIEAASGELEAGRQRIYAAGAWVQPQLHRMVEQQQTKGGQGAALPDVAIRSLSQTLNECNMWGSLFATSHLARQGRAYDVLEKWESLNAGVVQCFTYLLLSLPPGTPTVLNALREHDRLAEELGEHPLLGERVRQQNTQLHDTVARLQQAQGATP